MKQKHRDRDRSGLYDSGCIRLIEAIVRRAAEDHLSALRRLPDPRAEARVRETAAFFRSAYFSRLTGVRGDSLLRKIRKEGMRK